MQHIYRCNYPYQKPKKKGSGLRSGSKYSPGRQDRVCLCVGQHPRQLHYGEHAQ